MTKRCAMEDALKEPNTMNQGRRFSWDFIEPGTVVLVSIGPWDGYAGVLESVNAQDNSAVVLFNNREDFATISLDGLRAVS